MKAGFRIRPYLPLVLLVGLVRAGGLTAQTFRTLHSFTTGITDDSLGRSTNNEGANPYPGLVLCGNTLYGMASNGGSGGNGTVFKVNTDGTGFTTLHTFTATSVIGYINGTNADGAWPQAELILSGNTLYGTTFKGGSSGAGTVFAVNTDGSGFMTLHSFIGASEGYNPRAGLTLSGNTLYGTVTWGGSNDFGTIFAVNTNGTGFRILHTFAGGLEGGGPSGGLVLFDKTLYGTTGGGAGEPPSIGTVFAINADGTGFTTLYTNVFSNAGLVLSANKLYGIANNSTGMVFVINSDGTDFNVLHSFAFSDGAYPKGRLVLVGNSLYGTTPVGGSGNGTVFKVNTDGTGFTVIQDFTEGSGSYPFVTNIDGSEPSAGLISSGNTLYGTAPSGGEFGSGTVFSISLLPQLTITPSGANVIVAWPTNATAFTLESTSFLGPSAVWTTNLPAPLVVNGQNVVTNPVSGTQQFFRLSQ